MPETMSRVYIALLHHPVYNKHGETVTSAVTNLDIHDIARVTRTYGLGGFFIVNPDRHQREIALDICRHWTSGFGSTYNRARKDALGVVTVTSTLEETIAFVRKKEGAAPKLMTTSAAEIPANGDRLLSYKKAGELDKIANAAENGHLTLKSLPKRPFMQRIFEAKIMREKADTATFRVSKEMKYEAIRLELPNAIKGGKAGAIVDPFSLNPNEFFKVSNIYTLGYGIIDTKISKTCCDKNLRCLHIIFVE